MKRGNKRRSRTANELVEVRVGAATRGAVWKPIAGPETIDLLRHIGLPPEGRSETVAKLRDEAVRIFSRCNPPTAPNGSEIGLVIGYVQSGKTMSFTTVAALARDNGYQMVIVIAGTSLPLLRQSTRRLEKDLRLDTSRDRAWQHFTNPTPDSSDEANIRATLEDWDDDDVLSSDRRTVLITVMKQHTHLSNLNELLSRLPMTGRPVLVIDDEADQAGLNTAVRRSTESTTYKNLLSLRRLVPHHSYLQYTATPQAPLLINLIDVLSPRFVELLTPGPDYVGGKEFFLGETRLLRAIPPSEIPTPSQEIHEPPKTLLESLRLFFIGVAAGMIVDRAEGNRSMLVHPSQRTDSHETYLRWVRTIAAQWVATLELRATDPDRRALLKDFKKAYQDLAKTATGIPKYELIEKQLKHAIRRTRIQEINTRVTATPQVSWNAAYPHILVGGQAMDRGFTVEGLTVTYMPRSLGVGNADTVQQRARFFGYKKGYIGYCRVFLEQSSLDAYKGYVIHEEDVRARLAAHIKTGRPLSEWKREFFLTRDLKPTRKSVLAFDYMRVKIGDGWWNPAMPYESPIGQNRQVRDEFLSTLKMRDDEGHRSRSVQMRHLVAAGVSLRTTLEEFLTRYTVTAPEDSATYTLLNLVLREHLEKKENATCDVYLMSHGAQRERSLNNNGGIVNLFQGPHPNKDGKVYRGDRQIRSSDRVTVQIHNLTVMTGGKAVEKDVPTVAIWIPKSIAPDVIIQDQDNHDRGT